MTAPFACQCNQSTSMTFDLWYVSHEVKIIPSPIAPFKRKTIPQRNPLLHPKKDKRPLQKKDPKRNVSYTPNRCHPNTTYSVKKAHPRIKCLQRKTIPQKETLTPCKKDNPQIKERPYPKGNATSQTIKVTPPNKNKYH